MLYKLIINNLRFHFVQWLLIPLSIQATTISGNITGSANEPIPFVSIFIKGTTTGTTSNNDGYYSLELKNGVHEVVFKVIGYRMHVETINVSGANQTLNIKLQTENINLKEVTVSADAEDPAYPVIRQTIKKRKFYLEQVNAFSCDVYIKGVQRITKHPKKIMGMELDPEGDIDSATGIVYLTESVSKFNYKKQGQIKEEMISSKVSGDNQAFSYNRASEMLFNFYENLIEVEGLSERGFVSPINENALFYYRYKLLGTFYENGDLINKIQVIPKRKNDPVFHGVIYIMENSWRIHSTDLYLTKDAQIDFVDTLIINQLFVPVENEIWLPVYNKFIFSFAIMGIKGNGMYLGSFGNYILDPDFPKKFFNGEEMKVYEDANKKDSTYWSENRPIPLTPEEELDYRKRDSLQIIKSSKPYFDSLDRKSNKVTFGKIFFTGYQYYQRAKKRRFGVSPLISNVNFNTVQGLNTGARFIYYKTQERNRYFLIRPEIYYGFSNKSWNGGVTSIVALIAEKFEFLKLKGGSYIMQFNGQEPIAPIINTVYSLLEEKNHMKIYEKKFLHLEYQKEYLNGIYVTSELDYAQRKPLFNTTNFTIIDRKNRSYTSNHPLEPLNDTINVFEKNQALTFNIQLKIRFKQKYYTRPYEKIITGTKYPTLIFNYRKGIPSLAGSDVNFDLLEAVVSDEINLKLLGKFRYAVSAGSFLNNSKMYFIDYRHFNGNKTIFSTFKQNDFGLLDYYSYSSNKQYLEIHAEQHFGGFILNKFPLIRKLKLNEVSGINYLSNEKQPGYYELFVGIEKLGTFRLDFVTGYASNKKAGAGIRLGIKLGPEH